MVEGITVNQDVGGSHQGAGNNRLQRACTEFEAIFVNHMLKSMRNTLIEDGIFGKSNEAKIVKSMFDEKLALSIARGGGIGLGEMLFQKLKMRTE